ncbi:hypothetical protein [Azotobacter salinestris]|uniref:hypothetical protein n=1 Tax=Azotobacter salinestris TaxID=69964 RepID=UPI001AD7BDBE|nr:hypothetical protein [Azotobacter salinestris]
MDYEDDLPNLDHWKSVMEFTGERAALLMAMIDPFDVESLEEAKRLQVPRWKKAHAHALAIVSAIRQGVISPVACCAYVLEDGQWGGWIAAPIKPSDRTMEISPAHTIITRASLVNWVVTEKVEVTRPRPRQIAPAAVQLVTESITIEAKPEPLALPRWGHTSEGLELVDDAIYQFWSTVDPGDPATAPTKSEVVEYLEGRGASKNVAQAVDLILRPENMRKAKLRNRKVPTRETQ